VRVPGGAPGRRWVGASALLGAALLASGLTAPAQAAPAPAPAAALAGAERSGSVSRVVQTEQGPVGGTVEQGYRLFQGVPYAADPVGERRFAAPAPAPDRERVLDATARGPQCAQLLRQANEETFEEDCLNLNISTPAGLSARSRNLPVMVWIHGGAWVYGTGANYDGSKLAVQGDVVVVTINYRLGPLGFLNHPAFETDNLALLDQQAAMQWVQDNIAAFGGDPRKVTIAGESAGASSVCAQLAAPGAQGLFDKGIAQSLSCTSTLRTAEAADATGIAVAEAVGCEDPATVLACLREVDAEELLRAWQPYGHNFVAGGETLPLQPREAFETDRYAHVPMIMGNNRDELRLYLPLTFGPQVVQLTAAGYEGIVRSRFGDRADEVLGRYPVTRYDAPVYALAAVLSDYGSTLSTCSHVDAYDTLSDPPRPSRVYAYQFRDRTAAPLIEVPGYKEGAEHATELPYLFPGLFGGPLTAAQERLSDQMVGYWSSFVRTGNPNAGQSDAPRWPRYGDSRDVLALAQPRQGGIRTLDVGRTSRCGFWSTFPRAF